MSMDATKVEFGDFQTPMSLVEAVCAMVARDERPASVVEPTCGTGAFLAAAAHAFPQATLYGCDRNSAYVEAARQRLRGHSHSQVVEADFFSHDWLQTLAELPDPLLILGNPPWVTNSALGTFGGTNLPRKANIDRLRGINAVTGNANFDISEWMIRRNFRWLEGRRGTIAVLCKTSVARKVLLHAWSNGATVEHAAIYRFDAAKAFGVSVDACLLYARSTSDGKSHQCEIHDSFLTTTPSACMAYRNGMLLADSTAFERVSDLRIDGFGGWRSGLKHDCSRVFEFRPIDGGLVNGLGERASIEEEVVFPLLKSSDVAQGRPPRRRVLVPQRSMSESPINLEHRAPKAWRYLLAHREMLEQRRSSVYRKRPPFSTFGIGPYSFSPWKVAIAGLYKALRFIKIGPMAGKPVLLDDTCYFLPCDTETDCDLLVELLTSPTAVQFYSSLIFWDAKRPITAKLLNQLDLRLLAQRLGKENAQLVRLLDTLQGSANAARSRQQRLI